MSYKVGSSGPGSFSNYTRNRTCVLYIRDAFNAFNWNVWIGEMSSEHADNGAMWASVVTLAPADLSLLGTEPSDGDEPAPGDYSPLAGSNQVC